MTPGDWLKETFSWQKMKHYLLNAAVPALLFYAFSLLFFLLAGFKIMEVLRDPAQISGKSSFLGFLSNVGVWFWVSAAAVGWFGASNTRGQSQELLQLVGTMSLLLAVDDFFMIHDRYINQNICYAAYAVLAIALFFRHHRQIFALQGGTFLLAGALLGLSIFTDLVQDFLPMRYSHSQILEEGFKFVGGATWLYFVWQTATTALRRSQET